VLHDTYGVILYQEQVLETASTLGGLSLGEADQFRRAMTHDRSPEEMDKIRDTFLAGARRNGVADDVARQVFGQLAAFAAYGFCKAHAAAFAHIAYQTAHLKAHHPAEFLAAILSNQPMGFYPPEVIIQEAKHLGIEVRPVDVNHSRDRYTVEPAGEGSTWPMAIRVGLAQVAGISEAGLRAIARGRCGRPHSEIVPFGSLPDFCRRTRLPRPMVEHLIECGAFESIEPSRRRAFWQLEEYYRSGGGVPKASRGEPQLALDLPAMASTATPDLPADTLEERAAGQLGLMGMSLKCHPLHFYRETLRRERVTMSSDLPTLPTGSVIRVAGIVIARQRPPTRSGQTVIFITLEDEAGLMEVTVFPRVYERFGDVIFSHNALIIEGELQQHSAYGVNIVALRAKGLAV
jgi:error-prone DNA polymerase